MFKNLFSNLVFFKYFIIIFKNSKSEFRRKLIFLAFKNVFGSLLELILILFSGSLAFLFLDNNNQIENAPNFLIDLGINNLSNLQISILFVVISLSTTLYIFYINCEAISLANKISHDISKKLFNNFLNVEYSKYIKLSTDKFQQSTAYTQSLTKNILAFIEIAKGAFSIILVSTGIYLSLANSGIILILLAFVIYISIIIKSKKNYTKLSHRIKDLDGKLLQFTNICFGGFRDIKFSNLTEYMSSSLIKKDKYLKEAHRQFYIISIFPKYLLEFLFFLFIGIVLITNSLNILLFNPSFTEIIIIAFAGLKLIPQFQKIFIIYSNLKLSSAQIDFLFGFIDLCKTKSKIKTKSKFIKRRNAENLSYDLKNLSYNYPQEIKSVLKNINLSIRNNQWIVIQGTTGSGKSTLLDILLGLLEPTKGRIDIYSKQESINQSFENISHVAQFPFLFIGNIYKNIVGFDEEFIDEEILKKCLYYSCLDNDLKSGLLNLNDNVGERGINLSGGQRQRIGIARALYLLFKQKKSILILDECTSALDKQTSRKFIQRLGEIKNQICLVLVTHRTDILDTFDNIYFLKDGNLVEKN